MIHSRWRLMMAPAMTTGAPGVNSGRLTRWGAQMSSAGRGWRWRCPRCDDQGHVRRVAGGMNGGPAAQGTQRHGGGHGQDKGGRQRQARFLPDHRQHAADHDELALGQIHHPGHVIDGDQAQRDEHIDAAGAETGDQQLQVFTQSIVHIRKPSSLVRTRANPSTTDLPGSRPRCRW